MGGPGSGMKVRHGEAKWINGKFVMSPEYSAWNNMKRRCLNPTHKDYPYYGGRGIIIDSFWVKSFKNFLEDMGRRPSPLHSLDRINNDGPYCKANCRWATKSQQVSNRRQWKRLVWNVDYDDPL